MNTNINAPEISEADRARRFMEPHTGAEFTFEELYNMCFHPGVVDQWNTELDEEGYERRLSFEEGLAQLIEL